jgi:hypothetical protein
MLGYVIDGHDSGFLQRGESAKVDMAGRFDYESQIIYLREWPQVTTPSRPGPPSRRAAGLSCGVLRG